MKLWIGAFSLAWLIWGFVIAAVSEPKQDNPKVALWLVTIFAMLTATAIWGFFG